MAETKRQWVALEDKSWNGTAMEKVGPPSYEVRWIDEENIAHLICWCPAKEDADAIVAAHNADAALVEALRAIIVRCEEGDPRVDWRPTIASIAKHALASLTPGEPAREQEGE